MDCKTGQDQSIEPEIEPWSDSDMLKNGELKNRSKLVKNRV